MKVMQKKLHLLIAMMLFIVSSAMAQVTTSSLAGKITLEGTGEEVIGATVQAVHVPSGTKYAAVTNADGRYSIQGMRAGGPYTVTVSITLHLVLVRLILCQYGSMKMLRCSVRLM